MVSLKMEGLDKFIDLCDLTVKQTDKLCGRSIYPGGGIMYEYANQATRAIRTDPVGFRKGGMKWGPSKEQRDALVESLGIAPIRKQRWGMNVKVGYDGRNDNRHGTRLASGTAEHDDCLVQSNPARHSCSHSGFYGESGSEGCPAVEKAPEYSVLRRTDEHMGSQTVGSFSI